MRIFNWIISRLNTKETVSTTASFTTPFSVFEEAFILHENQSPKDAILWLDYKNAEKAMLALDELRTKHRLTNPERLGAFVMVSGADARKLISYIQRKKTENLLRIEVYKAAYSWIKDHPNRGDTMQFSVRMATETDARSARRNILEECDMLTDKDIVLDGKALLMPYSVVLQFCHWFEKINQLSHSTH